jgi:phosphopantetheine--protein transferase-like protein
LVLALTMAPAKRLADEAGAKAWLDEVCDAHGTADGVTVPHASQGGGGGGGPSMPMMGMMGGGGGGADKELRSQVAKLEKSVSNLVVDQGEASNRFLGKNDRQDAAALVAERKEREAVETKLEAWQAEHDEFYGNGITPRFTEAKIRVYDSSWNWVRQDALSMLLALQRSTGTTLQGVASHTISNTPATRPQLGGMDEDSRRFAFDMLVNRATPELLDLVYYHIDKNVAEEEAKEAAKEGKVASPVRPGRRSRAPSTLPANEMLELLADAISRRLEAGAEPTFQIRLRSAAPHIDITEGGKVLYSEPPRDSAPTTLDYVDSMAAGEQDGFLKLLSAAQPGAPRRFDEALTRDYFESMREMAVSSDGAKDAGQRSRAESVAAGAAGVSFKGKVALVTGCGKDSIGAEVIKALLEGGCVVIATTSSFGAKRTEFYRRMFEAHGSTGSRLIVAPFNQGSQQDTKAIVKYVYETLKLDLDFIVPFAAIGEGGRDISSIDGRSELSHRIMLTNLVRMLGHVRDAKEARNIYCRPAHVVIPLSPNHGNFGGDGLYAESKISLEILLNKWASEGWSDLLSLAGAVIGWTRGTGLMAGNNLVAEDVEKLGCRTFTTVEMAANIMALLHPTMVLHACHAPLWADLNGGFDKVDDLKGVTDSIRASVLRRAAHTKAIAASGPATALRGGGSGGALPSPLQLRQRARHDKTGTAFPPLPTAEELRGSVLNKAELVGMVDLERTVVCTGFGEVGPWGSSRTRWEMETYGTFSLEGCLELAWMLGMVKYVNGRLSSGVNHIGWVDTATQAVVADWQVKELYEERILAQSGVRVIDPDLFHGYEPGVKMFTQKVVLDRDMTWVEVPGGQDAEEYAAALGENVDIQHTEDGRWMMRLKKGAELSVPRALKFDRGVAGQIPSDWDATRYGIPEDIVAQVDRVTLFTLVSTAEAFIASGVPDPYEFYRYVHVSEVGNCAGGGMGGLRALREIFRGRGERGDVQGDVLQESFINTMPAWVNMLLLSSSGPIKTPVGACATAAESIDIAVETIQSGKARVVLCGGYDDFSEESSYEFASMKATSDSVAEAAKGRGPREMCRPCTDTRGGFMESQGAGIQILMSAQVALDMGCPIYGVVAHVRTATDQEGRSIPAPGQGILTTAAESARDAGAEASGLGVSPMLDLGYRRRNLQRELVHVDEWLASEESLIAAETATALQKGSKKKTKAKTRRPKAGGKKGVVAEEDPDVWAAQVESYAEERVQTALRNACDMRSQARFRWGNDFFRSHNDISPLRGALAVWGLDADDIAMASFHGTGTKANDKNESAVTQQQMVHLGRSEGNPLLVVCQKWLTGHPKGAAAAWMFNGLLQALATGSVPGNRNADNIDPILREFHHLLYPNRRVELGKGKIKAALMKSFGFGQAGGEVLIVHPNQLMACLTDEQLETYTARRRVREARGHRWVQEAFTGKRSMALIKNSAPYTDADRSRVYLDPSARAAYSNQTGTWTFGNGAGESKDDSNSAEKVVRRPAATPVSPPRAKGKRGAAAAKAALEVGMREVAAGFQHTAGITGTGVDVEPVSTFEDASDEFLRRNFTAAEVEYCQSAPNPAASFAGRWAAKEAVVKAMTAAYASGSTHGAGRQLWSGAASPLVDIEILPSPSGAPLVKVTGHAKLVYDLVGLKDVHVSISHCDGHAIAQSLAV